LVVAEMTDPKETLADKLTGLAFTFGAAHLFDKVTKAAANRHGAESLTVSLLREVAPDILGQVRQAFSGGSPGPSQRHIEHYAPPPQQRLGYRPANEEAEAYLRASFSLMEAKNYDGALETLQKAAELNHPQAQYMLGAIFANAEDYASTETWLTRAARNGHPEAGPELSKVMTARAAAQTAQRQQQEQAKRKETLDECFARGRALRSSGNHSDAIQCFRRAAEGGHLEAATDLGLCYYQGEGVEQDYGQAIDWFMKAATAREGTAMNYVGTCFAFGRGLPKDYAEAVDWWHMAADLGVDGAQYNLGVAYLRGHGVTADRGEALRWFRLAAAQGHATAKQKVSELGGDEEEPKARSQEREERRDTRNSSGRMTRKEALEIFDLKDGATRDDIRAAYTRLMQQVHPDKGGSNFFAKQLNEARKVLLG
jgi:hypothetical protein